jgi:hypothetical protein
VRLPTGDIDVVLLDGGEEPEVTRQPLRPRRWTAAVVALVATLAVLALPVADPEVTDPGPTTASTSPPERRRACPPPQAERLWCSFLADSPCCAGGAAATGSPVSGFRLASSTGAPTVDGTALGGPGSHEGATVTAGGGCDDPGGSSAALAQGAVTRRA